MPEDKPKKPGGQEYVRRNNEARKLELLAELRKIGWRPSDGSPIDAKPDGEVDGADDFAELGEPDFDDTDTALAWVRKAQLKALHLSMTAPLTDGLKARLKYINDFGSTIGTTQNRVDVEQRLEAVEHLVANVKPHGAVKTTEAHGHTRAEASSRGGTANRLRPVPGPPPGPDDLSGRRRSPEAADGRDDPDGGGPVG